MWALVALTIWASPPATVPPHVSCIDGHIVENLADCPTVPRHGDNQHPPAGGGPRGLLGLGGIGGLL